MAKSKKDGFLGEPEGGKVKTPKIKPPAAEAMKPKKKKGHKK